MFMHQVCQSCYTNPSMPKSVSKLKINELIAALKIMFENLPIIKIKAVEKKVAHYGWATRNFF